MVGVADSLPIGFKNDIVLQRKVKIVATARNITAVAIVQVNEDGAKYQDQLLGDPVAQRTSRRATLITHRPRS